MSIGTRRCYCWKSSFASLSRVFLARNRCVFGALPVLSSALVLPLWCLRSASFWCVSRVCQVRLPFTLVQLPFAQRCSVHKQFVTSARTRPKAYFRFQDREMHAQGSASENTPGAPAHPHYTCTRLHIIPPLWAEYMIVRANFQQTRLKRD